MKNFRLFSLIIASAGLFVTDAMAQNPFTDWADHGVIVSQNKVNWVDSTSFSMLAPDCIERNINIL